MPRITLVFNGKGGVGKTTTAQALATGIPRINPRFKTLVIDYDPSASLSRGLGMYDSSAPTMYDVITGRCPVGGAIRHAARCDIITSSHTLADLKRLYEGRSYAKGVFRLKEAIALLGEEYTHIILDTQPTIRDILTTQTLVAATDLVIPVLPETNTSDCLGDMAWAITHVRSQGLNPYLKVDGVLMTRCKMRENDTKAFSALYAQWAEKLDSGLYKAAIRDKKEAKKASIFRQSLFEYAPSSGPARDYLAFIRQYLSTERSDKYVN